MDSTTVPDVLEGPLPPSADSLVGAPLLVPATPAPVVAPTAAPTLAPPPAAPRPTAISIRVVTANVQSFPDNALTPAQALEDLTRNAGIGDIVLLQEIAPRYRALVQQAFPAAEWFVFYGRGDNTSPIAFRRSQFTKVAGRVQLLHPGVAGLHTRRYCTHLRLGSLVLGRDLHVTNVHLVAGAFNNVQEHDQALRLREWNEAIGKHQAMLARLVGSGLPVVGGGDYNRQLRQARSVGETIAGKPVTYAVGPASIDLLWFVDGEDLAWSVRSTRIFQGRDGQNPQRHSDHAARLANALLAVTGAGVPGVVPAIKTTVPPPRVRPRPEPRPTVTTKVKPRPKAAAPVLRADLPGPFELTTFGDRNPKKVDWKTRVALEEAERLLGYPLTVVQGSYNAGGVSQSAGTHDGGGAVDLLPYDSGRKVRVLRSIGFAAWYRPTIRGLWNAHVHAVMIDHGRLSPSAARQVVAYRAGRDGLKSNRVDNTWRPSPIPVFAYPPPMPPAGTAPVPAPRPAPGLAVAAAFPPRRTLDGIDTSHHQGGRIDIKAAQAAGLRWWYLKATEGSTVVDSIYRKRVRQARAAGVPVGAYHFARPDRGDAKEEARFFLKNSDIRLGDMLPMLDLESLEGMSLADLTRWTGNWVATVTNTLARRGLAARPIIYTPFDLGNGFGCLLWVARYSDDFRPPRIPRPWTRAAIWQHSDGRFGPVKRVPGFGPVDVNALHPDVPLSALRIRSTTPAAPPASPPPAPPPAPTATASPAPTATAPPAPTATGATAAPDDLQAVRSQLQNAVRSLQAALDSFPER